MPGERGVAVSGGDLAGVVVRNGAPDDVVLDGSKAVGTVATPDAAPGKPVTVTGYALAGGDAGNYTLRQPEDVTVDIAKSTAGSGSVAMEGWTYDGTARKVPSPPPEPTVRNMSHTAIPALSWTKAPTTAPTHPPTRGPIPSPPPSPRRKTMRRSLWARRNLPSRPSPSWPSGKRPPNSTTARPNRRR